MASSNRNSLVFLDFCLIEPDSLSIVQRGVLLAPICASGTEGRRVELKCSYPGKQNYISMYFCRDPCMMDDVLITLKKSDHISKGRYSIYDGKDARTFSVFIKNLQLQDAGVYYCGLDQWGFDTLTKVVLTVSKGT